MRTHLSKIEDYPAFLEACWQEHLKPREPDAPTVISLFAGCGGSSLGYSMAGYRELLAVEWDDHAVETFKLNFPGVPVWHGDIAELSVEECLRITGLKPGELDVLDGSPPCQGFSTEGETPHEPHILGRMCPERDEKGGYIIKVFFEKDRSGILTGKEFLWPTYQTIAPVVGYLCGGEQGKLGTPEEAAERDISAQEAAQEKADRERKELFDQIRAALMGAKTIAQLQTAWSLTNGKKTRLGEEFHTQLLAIKDSRKAELLEVA